MRQQALGWERDGRQWPLRHASRFVEAAGLRWHVQVMGPQIGQAPVVWLLHGTGASTHSWRSVMPLLAHRCQVVAVDLPGHAFTAMPAQGAMSPQFSLHGMARALQTLMQTTGLLPDLLVGHSAGAALAARMCLDQLVAPALLVSVNGALLPLEGVAGFIFSPMARWMASTMFVPRMFARRAADPRMRERLIAATGSVIDPTGQALYGRLMQHPGHASAALAMMANWNLQVLARDLPRLQTPVHLAIGTGDRTVPPAQAAQVHALLPAHPRSVVSSLGSLGHLAHEENPLAFAQQLLALIDVGDALSDARSPCDGTQAPTRRRDIGMSTVGGLEAL